MVEITEQKKPSKGKWHQIAVNYLKTYKSLNFAIALHASKIPHYSAKEIVEIYFQLTNNKLLR